MRIDVKSLQLIKIPFPRHYGMDPIPMNAQHFFAALPLLMVLHGPASADDVQLTPMAPRPAPDLTLGDLSGETLELSDFRGKTVVINFWATWCPPCREEMPALQRAWEQLRDDDVVVIGVAVGEQRASVQAYVKQMALSFPMALDPETEVASAWAVKGLPTTFVVDASGRIVLQAIGERNWDEPAVLHQIRSVAGP